MTERRLKHWGWGYEDQAPTATQLREAGEGIRARFGFGGEVEKPVPLEEVELRAPRLKAPARLGDLFSDDRYERVSRALGKAYRDVVRGFRGEFENPPDLVAFPRDEGEIETVLNWAEAGDLIAVRRAEVLDAAHRALSLDPSVAYAYMALEMAEPICGR